MYFDRIELMFYGNMDDKSDYQNPKYRDKMQNASLNNLPAYLFLLLLNI